MLVLLALLVLSLGCSRISCATIPDNRTDVLSLQDFKHDISGDPTRVLDSWNSTISHCMWQGITCSPTHEGRVVALELPGLNLVGKISPSVGNLTFLKTLNLSSNSLSGQLPPFNHLHRLQILDLSSNSLYDNIPEALANCSNLRGLYLRKNNLSGEIPPKLGLLSNLSILVISYNKLTGSIPPSLGNITHIDTINIASNMLTGSIPDELGKLGNISALLLGDNSLSGEFPRVLQNLSSLHFLSLEFNELGDELPQDIGDVLPMLQKLALNQNKFQGKIPPSLGNASGISEIYFQNNKLTGKIPSSFGKLQNLWKLNIESNALEANDSQSWEFFDALTNCSSLQLLSLSRNQLYGAIPNSVGNFSTSLQTLGLSANKLSGLVPPSIGNLGSLLYLALDNNHHLSGPVEEWISKLTKLQYLALQHNNFTGLIPSSVGNITSLTQLILIYNGFEGPIPPSLGKLQQLQYLDFAYNNFQGNIPQEISNMNQLSEIQLSSNKLTGEIPSTLNQCPHLVTINMDNNFLSGTIPASLGNIIGLSILNLSHNNLTGAIPKALGALQLSELDLSYNDLQGEMPINGIFNNATAVSLVGNLGLCGGAPDLHLPLCKAVTKNLRQYYLIRVLIPIFGFMSLLLLVYLLLIEKMRRKKNLEMQSCGEDFLKVSYNDLAQATMNFSESNLIGKGSYGTVYRGNLKENKFEVAVKVFDLDMRGAEKSFLSECEALRSIQHRNLLPIITACSTVDSRGNVFKALLYEFMPNGSLDSWLHKKGDVKTSKHLSLTQRLSIAVNIADALDYLHHDCGRPTVHCDLKPCNILLNDDMTALLGDFGIARLYVDSSSTQTRSTGSIGTIGYIAPEYAHGGQISTWGDVYSFGIVLLEMMIGKRPTDPMFKDGLDIVSFVERNTPDQILHVIDTNLKEECKDLAQGNPQSESPVHRCLVALLQVALSSTRPLPTQRMNMKEIASRMQAIKSSYLGSKDVKRDSLE